jgi:glucokinase
MPKATRSKKEFYIGVDVGGTKILAALIDPLGGILIRKKYPTVRTTKPSVIGHQIEEIISEVLEESDVSRRAIRGIGLGIPGIVDHSDNKILVTPNISLAGYPLAEHLRKKFKFIRLANLGKS